MPTATFCATIDFTSVDQQSRMCCRTSFTQYLESTPQSGKNRQGSLAGTSKRASSLGKTSRRFPFARGCATKLYFWKHGSTRSSVFEWKIVRFLPTYASRNRIQELESLLNDEDAFQDFFDALEQIQSSKKIETDLFESNKILAQEALAKRDECLSAFEQLNAAAEEQTRLRKEYDDLFYRHQNEILVICSKLIFETETRDAPSTHQIRKGHSRSRSRERIPAVTIYEQEYGHGLFFERIPIAQETFTSTVW